MERAKAEILKELKKSPVIPAEPHSAKEDAYFNKKEKELVDKLKKRKKA